MKTLIIFTLFLIIPLFYCLHYRKIQYFYFYAIMAYWFPIKLPAFSLTISEFFIYSGLLYFLLFKSKEVNKRNSLPIYIQFFFIFFVLGGFISAFNAVYNEFLFIGFRQTVLYPIAFIFFTSKVITEYKQIEISLKLFMISTLALLIVLYFYPKTSYWIQYRGISSFRLGGEYCFFGKYNAYYYESTLGALLGFLLPTFFSEYLSSRRHNKQFFIIFFLISIGLILTMGRVGWIAGTVGLSIVFITRFLSEKRRLIRGVIIVLISFFTIYFFLSFIFPYTSFALERFMSLENYQIEGTFQARLFQWYWAIDVFARNIFGIGFWNFARITALKGQYYAGNSTWLMLLLDVGIIGFIGFLILYMNLIIRMIKKRMLLKDKTFIFSGLLASLIVLPLSGSGEIFLQSSFYANFSVWFIISMAISMLSFFKTRSTTN